MAIELLNSIKWEVQNSRTHFQAHCWKLSLQFDNRTFFWTDHPQPITLWDGQTYQPQSGGDSSAREMSAALDPTNKEFKGFAFVDTGDGLTNNELRNGALVGAYLDEMLIDWRTPHLGPIDFRRYFIKSATFDEHLWRLECEGLTYVLGDKIGEYWGWYCRSELFAQGEAACNLLPGPWTMSSTITYVYSGPAERTTFRCAVSGDFASNGWADDGKLVINGHPNYGRIFNIRSWTGLGGGIAEVTLQQRIPNPIVVGTPILVYPGCDKTLTTCFRKFNNAINFQGEPWIPGSDSATRGVRTKF